MRPPDCDPPDFDDACPKCYAACRGRGVVEVDPEHPMMGRAPCECDCHLEVLPAEEEGDPL